MKNLKTYEEFDWQTFSTYAPLVGATIGHLIAKYGGKYLISKKRREYFNKSMQNDLYTRGRWHVTEEGNEINISKKMYNGDIKPRYVLNKETREFKFISDTYPISVRLSTVDMNNMINDLKWVSEVSESIEDCFHELRDEGFEVELRYTDFTKRGITVILYRKERGDDYFHIDVDPELDEVRHQYRLQRYGKNTFDVIDYIEQIKEFVNRVEGMYDVKLDDNYKQDRIYSDESILKKLDLDSLKNYNGTKSWWHTMFDVSVLVIPFIKK